MPRERKLGILLHDLENDGESTIIKNAIHSNIFVFQQRQYGILIISLWGTFPIVKKHDLIPILLVFHLLCSLQTCEPKTLETQQGLCIRGLLFAAPKNRAAGMTNICFPFCISPVSPRHFRTFGKRPIWQQSSWAVHTQAVPKNTIQVHRKIRICTLSNETQASKALSQYYSKHFYTFFIWLPRDSLTLNIVTFFTQK